MKKLVLLTIVFIAQFYSLTAQVSFVSINPDYGFKGQTLTTTITGNNFNFTIGSAPATYNTYLELNSTTIYPNWLNINSNTSLEAEWTIPAWAPSGNYDVVYMEVENFWPWSTTYHYVPGGFNIGDAFVTGHVFIDSDSSLAQNGTEPDAFNRKILLLPDSTYSFTDNNGDYLVSGTNGPKTIEIIVDSLWNITTPPSQNVNLAGNIISGIDFGIKPALFVYRVDASLTGGFPRCNTNVTYTVTFTNTGTLEFDGEIHFVKPANSTYVSYSITPFSVAGDDSYFNITNLQPGETQNLLIVLTLPGAGSIINPNVTVTAFDTGGNPTTSDYATLPQNVACAYDPNDKSVIPEGVQLPHYTLMSDTLDFVIRFQNTGNDTAFKVVIVDTLDLSVLDFNSFEMVAYSHPVIPELKTNGRVSFTFDNILLPDSNVNEEGSHGFVRFRCMALPGLTDYTVLNNTAHIYFDFNPAIVTNTTLNTLVYQIPVGLPEQENNLQAQVIPNPIVKQPYISFNNPGGIKHTIRVFTIDGKVISSEEIYQSTYFSNEKLLSKGIYLYELTSEDSKLQSRGKFVVVE